MDPNIKTDTQDISMDEIRVLSIDNFRKMHIDSYVGTTHLLKKAVMIENEKP